LNVAGSQASRICTFRASELPFAPATADAARNKAHENLSRLRLREVELLDLQRSAELLEHRGANLHVTILSTSDLVLLSSVWYPLVDIVF
jgi:hypothetical protein